MINESLFDKDPMTRVSKQVRDIMNTNFVIDVHLHIFDIKCVNKSYFLLRLLKDYIGLKSAEESFVSYDVGGLYKNKSNYEQGWEAKLDAELQNDSINEIAQFDGKKGLIDLFKARKFLGFKFMKDVYDHYINEFSLAEYFELPKKNVISTALMMDLETGWNATLTKGFYDQILELKRLTKERPILPFLFCDPRRANLTDPKENLYDLFNLAFSKDASFFGVKIYPALGYDPSDYRLWPIYEACEKYNIPVLSHCGGESVSTDDLDIYVYEGEKKVPISEKNRKDMAYNLNNPARWSLVLEKFPKLKLNLAHFGGYETWSSTTPTSSEIDPQGRKKTIFEFMKTYNNVYADFSYNLIEVNLSNNLKNALYYDELVRSRTLFGTDYWVVNKAGDLMKSQNDFLKNMDQGTDDMELSKTLCYTNPMKYLFDAS